ncbi:hypothetical protein ACJJIQ_07310 [Microbulbifer sp. ANSA003]|uniref:hypothetical protein n=1 Tax=unclassified Microbulbifer TaxID=2619833 RepID=UPI00403A1E5F
MSLIKVALSIEIFTFHIKEQFSIVFNGIGTGQCFTQQAQTIYSMLRFYGATWAHATVFRIDPTAVVESL